MKVFDLIDNKVIIKPESLLIIPFSEIWKGDKSKLKEKANKDITFIWFFCDFDSPYFSYDEEERANLIKEQVLEDSKYKVTELVQKGINRYKELNLSPSMRMLDSAYSAIFKMDSYFKNIDFDEDDIDKVTRAITNMPKMIQAINEAKELCKKEQSTSERVRGGASLNMFED
jgi:hypothetical protein